MIDLYYTPSPNGHKITLFLEEAQLQYRLIHVDISKGSQFHPDFLQISPNNKIPAIIDSAPVDGGKPISLFESGEILLYLAEKSVAVFWEDDIRLMIENVMGREEQYEDWDEDMMRNIHDSPETKAFFQYLNGLAETYVSYNRGRQVEMDCGA